MKNYSLEARIMHERINHLTHLVGFVLSIIGLLFLGYESRQVEDFWFKVGILIYGCTLVLLFGASTFYHGCKNEELKPLLRVIDHSCIYLLIAGTYTPFMLGPLRDVHGEMMLIIEWGIAFFGIIYKFLAIHRYKIVSLVAYLAMGWLVVLIGPALWETLPSNTLYWLVAGGLFYSLGIIFYVWKSLDYHHGIWHLFVLGGSCCHYFAVLDLL